MSSEKCLLGQCWTEGKIRSVLAALSRGSLISGDPLAWASGGFLLFSENPSFQFFSYMNHWLEGNVITKGVNFLFLLLWGYLEQAGEGEQRECSPQRASSRSCVSSASMEGSPLPGSSPAFFPLSTVTSLDSVGRI